MEWDNSCRKGRDGQKKKIGKANEKRKKEKGKSKKEQKGEEVNGQGGRGGGALAPPGLQMLTIFKTLSPSDSKFAISFHARSDHT